ncbi:MAG: phage minor head protein [Proteobacteria bacterium]|nr:phage minor head protein [Pseudomonadota bacterium]
MPWQPSAAEAFASLFRLPPEKALAYLAGRKKITPTYNWQDLWHDEHGRQFTVSRLTRLDILKSLQEGITASVNGDLSRRDWLKATKDYLQSEGWWGKKEMVDPATGETVSTTFNASRLKLIFDTNTRQAYAAGRWQGIEEAKATHPYIRYITKRDERVRDAHAAWDGLALPVDDPFWDTHTPPCGFRCRCRITTMTQEAYEAKKAEGSIKTVAPPGRETDFINKRTGEVSRVPEGVNPAFAYNPGKAAMRDANQAQFVGSKVAAAPAALGAVFAEQEKDAVRKLDAAFTQWVDSVRKGGVTRNATAMLGAMTPKELAAYVLETGVTPESAAILFEDRLIVGKKAARHLAAGNALTDAELKSIPALLRSADKQAYLQLENGNVIYLLPSGDKSMKLAVQVDFVVKGGKLKVNMVRSAFKIDPSKVTDAPKLYRRLG